MPIGFHSCFTSLLALLLALVLFRDAFRLRNPTSIIQRMDLSEQLSDTSSPAQTPLDQQIDPRNDMSKLDYSLPANVSKPRVLLVNDDGPPSKNSPHILGLYDEMRAVGWDVSVVLPSSQKSWGSMQFSLAGLVSFWYYYPIKGNADGSHTDTAKSWSATRRPINAERGEYAEWVLVDGSPTTASNSGLFNQDAFFGNSAEEMAGSPASNKTPFDLVVSGPNFGRNTGTAFALSSGTLGAAQAASLSGVRSIAVSYGHFMTNPPTFKDRGKAKGPGMAPEQLAEVRDVANRLMISILQKLWSNWRAEKDVGCYSINLPLCETIQSPEIFWTRIWENRYGPLFAASQSSSVAESQGPAYLPASAPTPQHAIHFAPQMASLLRPEELEVGTDVWAVQNGYISITRLRPNFMQVDSQGNGLDVASIEKQEDQSQKGSETETDGGLKIPTYQDGSELGKRWRL